MLNLDAKSVLAVFSLITFLFALLIYFYGRQNKSTFLGFRSLGTGLIILWLALTVNVIGETLNINSYRFISYPLKMVAFLYIYWGFAEFKKVKKNVAIEVVILFVFISLLFSAFHYHHHYHFFISFLSVYIMFYSFRIAYMLFKNIPLYNVFLNSALASLFLVYAFFNIIFISFINFSNYLSNFDDQRLIFALVTTMLEVLFITVYLMLINKEIVYIKDRFLSILAHEIKNPLNNIMGFSQLSMSKTNLEELNHFQNMIYVSARNGFELLTNLLEWSKNQLGKVNVHIRPFKIVELVNEINAFNDILVKNKKIKLVVAVHQDFEMLADRQLIGVVLNNLISNAIKFTSEEGLIILEAHKNNTNYVLTVTDNGIGMNDENVSKILSNEMLISQQGTNHEHGAGLGLYICNRYIQIHNGIMNIESKLGKGTSFTIHIPIPLENE